MRRSTSLAMAGLLVLAAGYESDKKKSDATGKTAEGKAGAEGDEAGGGEATGGDEAANLAEDVGVEPGAWEYDKAEGAAAVLATVTGTVEIRRTGTETWDKAEAATELHEGDQVRTAGESTATVAMADETA